MSDLTLDIIGYIMAEPAITWGESLMAPMRKRWLFRVLRLALVFIMVFKSMLPSVFTQLFGFIPYIILPIVFFKGKMPARILLSFLGYSVVVVSEFVGMFFWYAATGSPVYDYDAARAEMPMFLVMHVINTLALVMCFFLMRKLIQRVVRVVGPTETSDDLVFHVLVPALQMVVLMTLCWLLRSSVNQLAWSYYAIAVVAVASLVVDGALIFTIERAYTVERELDARASLLDEVEREQARIDEEAKLMARIRHDFKNQMGVASTLAETGRTGEAEQILLELRDRLQNRA